MLVSREILSRSARGRLALSCAERQLFHCVAARLSLAENWPRRATVSTLNFSSDANASALVYSKTRLDLVGFSIHVFGF
jgi:hypothetical protein